MFHFVNNESEVKKVRKNLKLFRIKTELSQAQMSEKLGCSRATYNAIENGIRCGNMSFWHKLQDVFKLPDSEMWGLMQNE